LVGKPYSIAGRTYYPSEKHYAAVGLASWYGDAFHGRLTANGEIYDRDSISAAHPTMPLPCYARVTNLRNHYSMIVRVNDRGPFAGDRIMDVSRKAAEALGFRQIGTTPVKVEYVGAASLAGSDDQKLLATLRSDRPASVAAVEDRDLKLLAEDVPIPIAAADTQTASTAPDTATDSASASHARSSDIPLPPARPLNLRRATINAVPIALR
jgi:rare lipoprotein A